MSLAVKVAPSAVEDMRDLHAFISDREGRVLADRVLDGMELAILSLGALPRRGHVPPELAGMGFKDVLEVHFKPYRVIYEAGAKEVLVLVVADGRRDLKDLLSQRILR